MASSIDFKEYHSDYKKLLKIKPLVDVRNNKSRLNQNVADVFISCIKSIGKKLSAIQINPKIDERIKSRAMAMRLALILEETIFINSCSNTNKINKLQRAIAQFELHKLKPETFYVFFKAYGYVAFVSGGISANYDVALDALRMAEEMFQHFEQNHRDPHQPTMDIYEPWQLFSKKSIMQPMADAFNQMSISYIHNLTLLSTIYERLEDKQGHLKTIHSILVRGQHFEHMKPLEWIMKLLETIPITIDMCQFHRARYYMEVADQVLKNNLIANKFVESEMAKCQNIQKQIAGQWLNFTLAIFQYSRAQIQSSSTRNRQPDKPSLRNNINNDELNNDAEVQGSYQFETITLEKFQFEFESMYIHSHSEAMNVSVKCIAKVKYLLEICDILAQPIDYVSYNYQLAALYAHLAFFATAVEDEFNYLKCRIDVFVQMLNTMNSMCPRVIGVLQKDILVDLNEFQIDLLQCNVTRISDTQSDAPENVDDGNGVRSDKGKLIKLLNEIRSLNKALL